MDINLNNKNQTFIEYFHTVINNRVEMFISELNVENKTYLFSGILRNFFLSIYEEPRDLDIVLSRKYLNSDITTLLKKYGEFKINSFGGYKITIKGLKIDIWYIEDTWAIKNDLIDVNMFNNIENAVLHSTFFNFSSILFDFKNKAFIYNSIFLNFLKNKTIDIVLENNPSEVLCVVNIVYYAEKYKLNISNKTKEYFIDKFPVYSTDQFDKIQLKHFGRILYDYSELAKFSYNLNV